MKNQTMHTIADRREKMLEKLDLTKALEKDEYKEKMLKLTPEIGKLQRECKDLGIPIMIAFEGYDAAGKGEIGRASCRERVF